MLESGNVENAAEEADLLCGHCEQEVPHGSQACPMCGQPLQVNPAQKLDRPWTVLVLLFGATGVLGLPVLWASRSFSIRNKIVLSLAVTIYTAALVAAAWLAIRNAWNAWHEAFPTQ